MQTQTRMDMVVIGESYHIKIMDEDIKWMKPTQLMALFVPQGSLLYIYFCLIILIVFLDSHNNENQYIFFMYTMHNNALNNTSFYTHFRQCILKYHWSNALPIFTPMFSSSNILCKCWMQAWGSLTYSLDIHGRAALVMRMYNPLILIEANGGRMFAGLPLGNFSLALFYSRLFYNLLTGEVVYCAGLNDTHRNMIKNGPS